MMVPRRVLDYVNKLSTGDHVVLFYEDPEYEREVLFTFLKEGLRRGEEAVYITNIASASTVSDAMKCFGIDPSRVLIFDKAAREEAQRSGTVFGLKFEWGPEGIMKLWKQWLQSKEKKVRVAISTSPKIFEPSFLLATEKAYGCTLHMPMTLICAYHSKEVAEKNGQLFTGLLKTHGHVIFPGIALNLLV